MENKDWTLEDLTRLMEELEKEASKKFGEYKETKLGNGLIQIESGGWVVVANEKAWHKAVNESMRDLVHNPEKKHPPFKMENCDKSNLPRKKKKQYKKFTKKFGR